jgi:hypothetical protein
METLITVGCKLLGFVLGTFIVLTLVGAALMVTGWEVVWHLLGV